MVPVDLRSEANAYRSQRGEPGEVFVGVPLANLERQSLAQWAADRSVVFEAEAEMPESELWGAVRHEKLGYPGCSRMRAQQCPGWAEGAY